LADVARGRADVFSKSSDHLVVIARRAWDASSSRFVLDSDPRGVRLYTCGDNHHVEIRQRDRTTSRGTVAEWFGDYYGAYDAAKRNAIRLQEIKKAGVPKPRTWRSLSREQRQQFARITADINRQHSIVDRNDDERGRFIMSLAEGETIFACRPDRPNDAPDYYVVSRLETSGSEGCIHFVPHHDARSAASQDRWRVTPSELRVCGPTQDQSPYKVWVGRLGDVKRLDRD